jgi:hypothetical protein
MLSAAVTPTTPIPPESSEGSGTAFILNPRRSVCLLVWRVLVFCLLSVSILHSGWELYVKVAALCAVGGHARLFRPPEPAPIIIGCDGLWALPAEELYDMRLGERTVCSGAWVRLHLTRGPATNRRVLLLADQFDREDWRRLQVSVREAPIGRIGGDT